MTRRGFTLTEAMMALAVTAIVFAAVASSFVTVQRMLRTAMAESELSLAAREIREKLLFRISPTVGGVHYAGLLSGRSQGAPVDSSGVVQLTADAVGASLGSTSQQSMRLMLWSETCPKEGGGTETRRYIINDHTPDKDAHRRWLWPGMMSLVVDDGGVVDYEKPLASSPLTAVYRLYYDVNLRANTRNVDGTPVVRRERVSVPLFGKIQPVTDQGGGY